MQTIQWTPSVNALTTPQSYKIRFTPRNILGRDEKRFFHDLQECLRKERAFSFTLDRLPESGSREHRLGE